jgi:hypothetical protein
LVNSHPVVFKFEKLMWQTDRTFLVVILPLHS